MAVELDTPSPLAYDSCSNEARTCILIGRVPLCLLEATLEQCSQGVFWLVDEAFEPSVSLNGLLRVPVDSVSEEDFMQVLGRFLFRASGVLPGIRVGDTTNLMHAECYECFSQKIAELLRSAVSFMPSQQVRAEPPSFERQVCVLRNINHWMQRRAPANLGGALAGKPALIVGSGPSLEVSLASLRPWWDRFIVFAVDSSLKTLHEESLRVDCVVNIDPDKVRRVCVPESMEVPRVALTLQSSSDWLNGIEQSWMLSLSLFTEHWLKDHGVAMSACPAASNCGLTAMLFAQYLGCQQIFLAGIDMACDSVDPSKTHASKANNPFDEAVASEVEKVRSSAEVCVVPGNYAEEVPTIFYRFYEETNAWLRLHGDMLDVVNVNDRGAVLESTRLVHPKDLKTYVETLDLQPIEGDFVVHTFARVDGEVVEDAVGDQVFQLMEAAAKRGLILLEAFENFMEDQSADAVKALRKLALDPDISALLGCYFMDRMTCLAADEPMSPVQIKAMLHYVRGLLCVAQDVAQSR